MTERETVEREIRSLLSAEISATSFSNRVFGQFTGLFSKLGKTREQREAIIQSDLWKQAQNRFHELLRKEQQQKNRAAVTAA